MSSIVEVTEQKRAEERERLREERMQTAARLTHWVAENAKTARAFLKRVDVLAPLSARLGIAVPASPATGVMIAMPLTTPPPESTRISSEA